MSEWTEAPREVLRMAEELIREFHNHLGDANIAILMKTDENPKHVSQYKTWAQASKIPPKFKTLLDFDFLIWIQEEIWVKLNEDGRKALLDHELCHCGYDLNEVPVMRHHDFEEFSAVIQRHGLWRKSLVKMGEAVNEYMQNPLFKNDTIVEFKSGGKVTTLSGDQLNAWANQRAL